MLWKNLLRPIVFRCSPERAHHLAMRCFSTCVRGPIAHWMRQHHTVNDPRLAVHLLGHTFTNPVGLAAGFDKDGQWFRQLPCLGFSHVEIGTLTGQPQPGNPPPRLFRLPADQAIINRMGFNNRGAESAAQRLAVAPPGAPQDILGINIGKTKIVPLENAIDDYLFSFERLFAYGDYFTINVSSPNTPGLRELQNRDQLLTLLRAIEQKNQTLADDHAVNRKPVLLKIAPDLSDAQLSDIVAILHEVSLDGIIATNTTISRNGLVTDPRRIESIGNGGLSGRPLTQRSRQVVRTLFQQLENSIPVIGVGGIMTGEDAWQMIIAGASLIQVYTGFIYGGPSFVRQINRYLQKKLDQHQLESISDAVGAQELA